MRWVSPREAGHNARRFTVLSADVHDDLSIPHGAVDPVDQALIDVHGPHFRSRQLLATLGKVEATSIRKAPVMQLLLQASRVCVIATLTASTADLRVRHPYCPWWKRPVALQCAPTIMVATFSAIFPRQFSREMT